VPPLASVVIPVRNDAQGIVDTLRALGEQTLPRERFEVLVVDDASDDGTAEAVVAHEDVRLLRQDHPTGSYGARNRGMGEAGARIIAFTDAGCLPAPDWIERGIARLEAGNGVIGGHIAMPLGPAPTLAAMVDVIHHLDQQRYVEEYGSAVTANLVTERSVFDRVGPFHEGLRSSGDVEWTTRAVRAGIPLVYAPEVVVTHHPRTRARQLLRKSSRVAQGGSALRALGLDEPGPTRLYLSPSVLVPRHRDRGRARLAENGARPGAVKWTMLAVAQLMLVQIPQALAALATDVRGALKRRGASVREGNPC
jgi:glycosyltransferase involved in cell wall biosynthesis